ncbi:uncharacterized protein LOC111303339 [Durio zibethinus]|uniref:Uncharacterized protein LOC111303339 n=1 Tax=Durio zibethinus TaxID=66656 RepID=A0A6P5ZS30_DURZI|nr:uncharacterized protein LOC111303339 [Durio zibethinus]
MATGAADGLFRSLYEGCISGYDIGIDNRPYHQNCRCALHDKSRGNCPHASPKSENVSYPIRRAWSEGCLTMAAASCHSSPSSLPALAGFRGAGKRQLGSCKEEEEDNKLAAAKVLK